MHYIFVEFNKFPITYVFIQLEYDSLARVCNCIFFCHNIKTVIVNDVNENPSTGMAGDGEERVSVAMGKGDECLNQPLDRAQLAEVDEEYAKPSLPMWDR